MEESTPLPSPFLWSVNPFDQPLYSPRFTVGRQTKDNQWERSDVPVLPSPGPSSSGSLYPHHSMQQSVQCAAKEPTGSVQRNNRRGRERRREREWIVSTAVDTFISHTAAIPTPSYWSSFTQSTFLSLSAFASLHLFLYPG